MATAYAHKLKMLEGCSDQGAALFAGHWAIGGTGAVGTQTRCKSVTLTRDNVGLYTLQLTNKEGSARCPAIGYVDAVLLPASGDVDPSGDTDAVRVRIVTVVPSTGTVTIALVDEADVVREAASGAELMVFIVAYMSGVT